MPVPRSVHADVSRSEASPSLKRRFVEVWKSVIASISTRMDSPLRLAAGVQRVQTDELTVDEVVAHLLEVIRGGDRR